MISSEIFKIKTQDVIGKFQLENPDKQEVDGKTEELQCLINLLLLLMSTIFLQQTSKISSETTGYLTYA